jgi:two-component system chemotaxis sensor kinase CheA
MLMIDREALLRSFLDESEELLVLLERSALELGDKPGDVALVEEMFRCAHTLKGNASCVGFDGFMALAHEIESMFAGVTVRHKPAGRTLSALSLAAVDALRERLRLSQLGDSKPTRAEADLLRHITAWLANEEDEGAEAPAQAQSNESVKSRTLRVEVGRLDQLVDLVGEVAIAQGRLSLAIEHGEAAERLTALQNCQGLFKNLQEQVLRLRLVPLGPTFERFRRAVRDLAEAAGKQAELVVDGADVEVDMALADALRDPLAHMVRNSIDHGLETPSERIARGKPKTGRIALRARHEGNHVVIEVEDDGRGLDPEKLIARAKTLGVEATADDESAVSELAFMPGLSTKDAVTKLSGRGLGMDVVRRNIEALRGSVSLASRPGNGVTASLKVPLTVAVIQGFGVRVGLETYILPLDSILECVNLDTESAMGSAVGGLIELRGQPLPFLSLRRQFSTVAAHETRRAIVVLEHGGKRAGLEVDSLLGEVQTVIKPLGPLFADLKVASGSAVLGDGRVALVLDVGSLLRSVAA